MNRNFLFWGVMLISLTACPAEDEDMAAPTAAIDKALLVTNGTIRQSEAEIEDGVAAWKVEIITSSGAEVEVYCRQDNLALLRIDGEGGPFDYNAVPGNGLIDFSQAKAIGAAETPQNLVEWRLRPEDKFNNQWVYSLEYTGVEINVNATDGSLQ